MVKRMLRKIYSKIDITIYLMTILFLISTAYNLLPVPAHAVVYFTREEAIKDIFPASTGIREDTVILTDKQRKKAEEILGYKIKEERFTFIAVLKEKTVVGYGLVLHVIGKELPITFMVAVDPDGKIAGVRVLAYRESEGSEIRYKRFLRQFIGKTIKAPLSIDRDIDAITGATLSSRSAAYAVKKTLTLYNIIYKKDTY